MDHERIFEPRSAPSGNTSTAARRYRVLLVDDDALCLETTTAVLADDFDVVAVATAELALARLAEGDFELLLTDHSMPGMSGAELFARIHALGLPVGCVICTGDVRRVPVSIAKEPGLVAVVEKPAPPMRLIRLLQQVGRLVDLRRSLMAVHAL